jgi:hypothetical protein
MDVQATLSCGLEVSGNYHYEAERGPSYSCGGTPASVTLDDEALAGVEPDGYWNEALCEHVGQGAARVTLALARMGLPLPASVSDWLMSHYADEVDEALCEAASYWEPDCDE